MPHLPKQGFTLIELLIVIAVLGVLATVLLVAINPLGQLQRARNAGRRSDLKQISDALGRYYALNGSYPSTGGTWCGDPGSWWNCGSDWIPGLVASGELKKLPQDPRVGQAVNCDAKSSSYLYVSNGTDYKLLAHCTPEGNVFPPNGSCNGFAEPLCDPSRPTWAWQISTPGALYW